MKLKLGSKEIAPLRFELEDGAALRFAFKRKLNRQQRQECLRKSDTGRTATEIMDIAKFCKFSIASVTLSGGLEIEDANGKTYTEADEAITHQPFISMLLMDPALDEEVFSKIVEYVMGENSVGEDEGKL